MTTTYTKLDLHKLATAEKEKKIRDAVSAQVGILTNMVLDQAKKGNTIYRCPILPNSLLATSVFLERVAEEAQSVFVDSVVSIEHKQRSGQTDYITICWA
jgi:urease gamma subunit